MPDALVVAFQRLTLSEPGFWNPIDRIRIAKSLETEVFDEHGDNLPLIKASEMMNACFAWVRGMHAALYNEFLPPRQDLHRMSSPLPMAYVAKSKRGERVGAAKYAAAMERFDNWEVVNRVINTAVAQECVDRVSAWGGRLKFHAAWGHVSKRRTKKGMRYVCFWGLEHPGVQQLSASVYGDSVQGDIRPWHGIYLHPHLPEGAVSLVDEIERLTDH